MIFVHFFLLIALTLVSTLWSQNSKLIRTFKSCIFIIWIFVFQVYLATSELVLSPPTFKFLPIVDNVPCLSLETQNTRKFWGGDRFQLNFFKISIHAQVLTFQPLKLNASVHLPLMKPRGSLI